MREVFAAHPMPGRRAVGQFAKGDRTSCLLGPTLNSTKYRIVAADDQIRANEIPDATYRQSS
jgi:hypothetical protein